MDEAVKVVDDLKRRLVDAEEEKQKALGQLLTTEEMLKSTKEEVCLTKCKRLLFLHRAIVCLRESLCRAYISIYTSNNIYLCIITYTSAHLINASCYNYKSV